jgi:hypothetical protein
MPVNGHPLIILACFIKKEVLSSNIPTKKLLRFSDALEIELKISRHS